VQSQFSHPRLFVRPFRDPSEVISSGSTSLDTLFLKRHRVADEQLHFHELI
jgi:hypothetical protein